MDIKRMDVAPDKAAIYIRWSSEDQAEGTTLEVQSEGCRHYVLSQGWRVREELIFIDDGYSGASLARPGLTRLRDLVKEKEVECVVVYKLDRLSRSVADTARLVMDEWDGICSVKSAREPIDTTSQAGKMFFYTLMNYAEWERSVIRDRTHSGRVRRAQEGRNPGITVPYGYTWAQNELRFEIVPHEATIVKRIFESYRLGAGILKIVNDFNTEGTTFRNGRKWRTNTVSYILSNRSYMGDFVWGLRTKNPKYKKLPGEKQVLFRDHPLVTRAGVFPPIISPEEFDLVQATKRERPCKARGSGGRSMASEYLMTGILRCGLCDRPMVGQHNNSQSVNGYYYSCTGRRDRGPSVCPARSIQCHLLDKQVVDKLLSLYGTQEAAERCVTAFSRDAAERLADAKTELTHVERQLYRMEERDRRICRDYTAELLSIKEFRDLRTALQQECRELKTRRDHLTITVSSLEVSHREQGYLKEQVKRLGAWEQLPVGQRKHLLRQVVTRVQATKLVTGLSCDITWRIATSL